MQARPPRYAALFPGNRTDVGPRHRALQVEAARLLRFGQMRIFAITDGLFCAWVNDAALVEGSSRIDQSIPIVAETEQIADRRNSPLNSRAQISGGSWIRFFRMSRKNLRR
jgi:hypothetical protein